MLVVSIVLFWDIFSIAWHPLLATRGLLVQPVTQHAHGTNELSRILGRCELAGWHGVLERRRARARARGDRDAETDCADPD